MKRTAIHEDVAVMSRFYTNPVRSAVCIGDCCSTYLFSPSITPLTVLPTSAAKAGREEHSRSHAEKKDETLR